MNLNFLCDSDISLLSYRSIVPPRRIAPHGVAPILTQQAEPSSSTTSKKMNLNFICDSDIDLLSYRHPASTHWPTPVPHTPNSRAIRPDARRPRRPAPYPPSTPSQSRRAMPPTTTSEAQGAAFGTGQCFFPRETLMDAGVVPLWARGGKVGESSRSGRLFLPEVRPDISPMPEGKPLQENSIQQPGLSACNPGWFHHPLLRDNLGQFSP
jgi:hypothetical protein